MQAIHVSPYLLIFLVSDITLCSKAFSGTVDHSGVEDRSHEPMAAIPNYERTKRTIWDFPIRNLLKGARRLDEKIIPGQNYYKQQDFNQAQKDFWSMKYEDVRETYDGQWVGVTGDKFVTLDRLEKNTALIQVYPYRVGAPPILSIRYEASIGKLHR